jgi:hypothetical protein
MLELPMPVPPFASVTAADLQHLLGGHDVHPKRVEFLHEITPNGVEFAGFDAHGNRIVRGVVALKARLSEGTLVASAEIELLPDGEIPF